MDRQVLRAEGARVPTFSSAHAAALTVDGGEVFVVETADRFRALAAGGKPDPLAGNMVGPVHVRGAGPGDTLAIEVLDIQPLTGVSYVLTSPGYGVLGDRVETRVRAVEVDDAGIHWNDDVLLERRPMIGKIGVAPAGDAAPNKACGEFGGTLSSTQLGPGATLYLPVFHPGALLCLEDVHAGMGDGEATASAFEMAARVTLRCTVEAPTERPLPLLVTAEEVVTHGQAETLDAAAAAALEAMLRLLELTLGVDATEAAMLAGTAVDLRISFMGDQPRKVRAAVPRKVLGM